MRFTDKIIIVGELVEDNGYVYKKCTNCGRLLTIDNFGYRQMDPSDPDTLRIQPQCKECR